MTIEKCNESLRASTLTIARVVYGLLLLSLQTFAINLVKDISES